MTPRTDTEGARRTAGPRTMPCGRWMLCTLAAVIAGAAAPAMAVPTCTVASGAQLAFGDVVALASTGDRITDSGVSFWVNCNSEVTSAPQLYSSNPRLMVSGSGSLPFQLSLVSPGGVELASSPPGAALDIVRNGTNQTVTLYAKVLASSFRSLRPGTYATSLTMTVVY